jgi:phosphoglycolate phosphatase
VRAAGKGIATMIGDREHDIIGAKNNNLHSVGVLWGYGTKKELETAGADTCLAHPFEFQYISTP